VAADSAYASGDEKARALPVALAHTNRTVIARANL
jgi:hypothetical protein